MSDEAGAHADRGWAKRELDRVSEDIERPASSLLGHKVEWIDPDVKIVRDALEDACFAECRAVGAAEHEAAHRERDAYFAALDRIARRLESGGA